MSETLLFSSMSLHRFWLWVETKEREERTREGRTRRTPAFEKQISVVRNLHRSSSTLLLYPPIASNANICISIIASSFSFKKVVEPLRPFPPFSTFSLPLLPLLLTFNPPVSFHPLPPLSPSETSHDTYFTPRVMLLVSGSPIASKRREKNER